MEGEFNLQLIPKIFLVFIVVLTPAASMAYVGPGLGAGAVGVVLGIIGSILVALFAVLWYPLKRLVKKIKKTKKTAPQDSTAKSSE